MTTATLSALLLLAAAFVHSFSYMSRKLPVKYRHRLYPSRTGGQLLIDATWLILFFTGIRLAFSLSTALGITAGVIYFVALPFVYQPMLAKLLGFKNMRDYLQTLVRRD